MASTAVQMECTASMGWSDEGAHDLDVDRTARRLRSTPDGIARIP
jgi:hypothetical protein